MPDPTGDRAKYTQALNRQRAFRGGPAERQAWEDGRLRPFVISQALDMCGLYGPQVDEACGTMEPAVDMWEAGQLYPTWDELRALAELTLYPIAFFTTVAHEAIAVGDTTLRFTLQPGEEVPPQPVLCFDPFAIKSATGTTRCPHCGLSSRPVVSMHDYAARRSGVENP
jgi:hypothetical protein